MTIDISCVSTNLWVGAHDAISHVLPGFHALALCAREHQPTQGQLRFRGQVVRAPIPDSALDDRELSLVLQATKVLTEHVVKRRRVLVTCSAGVNRSCLVAGMVLANTTRMSVDEIIDRLRARRHPNALYNAFFRDVLGKFRRPRR